VVLVNQAVLYRLPVQSYLDLQWVLEVQMAQVDLVSLFHLLSLLDLVVL
jgi:hypothetical protein